MSQDVELEQLVATPPSAWPAAAGDLRRLSAVPVDLSVEIGRTRMTVGETLELREGSVITLDRMAGEPVDLLVNGTPIARGEVVVIDEQFGLRLTSVLADGAPVAHVAAALPELASATAGETLEPPVAELSAGDEPVVDGQPA